MNFLFGTFDDARKWKDFYFSQLFILLLFRLIEKGETFVVELEGSQNVRILLYEECNGTRSVLRGKCTQRLSRSWLQSEQVERSLNLGPASLDVALRFVPSEVTLRRVPSAKPQGLFGAKIQQVCK